MNITAPQHPIHSIQFEGFFYVESNGQFFKGCRRCGGTGHYSFDGQSTVCYECRNVWEYRLGDIFETRAQAEKWCHKRAVRKAQRDRKRAAEHQKLVDQAAANREALRLADPEVHAFLMSVTIEDDTQHLFASYDEWAAQAQPVKLEQDGFIRTMAETLRWVGPSKPFTPNMIAAVRKTMERRSARAAEAAEHPAPSGRVVVTGEVVSTRIQESDFGVAYKMLVKADEGFKVWCSIPSALLETTTLEEAVARRITFTATLEPSKDDVAFAFGKRPAKGAWL